MKGILITCLILLFFGIVLVLFPMQLFARNYPNTERIIKKNSRYMNILKALGFVMIFFAVNLGMLFIVKLL